MITLSRLVFADVGRNPELRQAYALHGAGLGGDGNPLPLISFRAA